MNIAFTKRYLPIAFLSALLISAGSMAYYGRNAALDASTGNLAIGDSVGSELGLKRILDENPYDIEAWEKLGDFYQANGRLDEALIAYDRAYKISGDDPDFQAKSSIILVRLNRIDEAESRALVMLKNNLNSLSANKLMGWLCIAKAQKERLKEALPDPELLEKGRSYFLVAARIELNNAEAFIGLGATAKFTENNIDAEKYLKQALQIDSNSYWAWQMLGEILIEMGRDSEARRAYIRASELSDGRPDPYLELASLSRITGNYREAADYMQKVGEKGAFGRGRDLEAAGYLKEAESEYLNALLLKPEDEVAMDRLELVRIKLLPVEDTARMTLAVRRIALAKKAENVKNTLLAFLNYHRAIRLAPQYSSARLDMARFLAGEKNFSEAVKQLQRVEELTRSQNERLVASDLMEVITHQALAEMEKVHEVEFGDIWDQPTSQLGALIGNPEVLEEKIRWSITAVPKPRLVIAILPFSEPVRPYHDGVGEIAGEWLSTTLELLPGFKIIPMQEVKRVISEKNANRLEDIEPASIGEALGADVVIASRIIEAEEKIRIVMNVIKVPAGPIIFSQSLTTEGTNSLTRAIVEISNDVAGILSLKGAVLRRHSSDIATINLGRIHGIVKGDSIQIFQKKRDILVQGLDWPGEQERSIAVGYVSDLTERYAEVKITEGMPEVRAGDSIRRIRKSDSGRMKR